MFHVGNCWFEMQYQKKYSLSKDKMRIILTRYRWLVFTMVLYCSRSCCVGSVQPVSALRAHSSQWGCLCRGEHSPAVEMCPLQCGFTCHICGHMECNSDVVFSNLGKHRWDTGWSERAELILFLLFLGFDAFQWACWPPPPTDPGSGGRTVPHSFCSPEGQFLQ